MNKIVIGLLLAAILMSNAAFATTVGYYYTGVTEPKAASQIEQSSKKAEGSTMSILSLLALGDASAQSIAAQAGIKEIKYIDKNTFSIWLLFARETFTVYGD